MYIYTSEKVTTYVYICTHKLTNQFYIGSRYSQKLKLPSHLDFPKYKTSAPAIANQFDEFNWIIFAEFLDGNSAYDYEQQLIFENWDNPLLLNKHCHYGKARFKRDIPPWLKGTSGLFTHSAKTKELIRKKRAVQIMNPASALKSVQTKIKNGTLSHSEETKTKMRKPKARTTCPHCLKVGGVNVMQRHHFDNCKFK